MIDEIEYFQSLPFTVPIILVVFYLSKKANFYSLYRDISSDLNTEIELLFEDIKNLEINSLRDIKNEFELIKKNKSNISLKNYNDELLKLRKRLEKL